MSNPGARDTATRIAPAVITMANAPAWPAKAP